MHTKTMKLARAFVRVRRKWTGALKAEEQAREAAEERAREVREGVVVGSKGGRQGADRALAGRSARRFTRGMQGGDMVRSEHEMEQKLTELREAEERAKQYQKNKAEIPPMLVSKRERFSRSWRRNENGFIPDMNAENDAQRGGTYVNPWTDIEKIIFLDKVREGERERENCICNIQCSDIPCSEHFMQFSVACFCI